MFVPRRLWKKSREIKRGKLGLGSFLQIFSRGACDRTNTLFGCTNFIYLYIEYTLKKCIFNSEVDTEKNRIYIDIHTTEMYINIRIFEKSRMYTDWANGRFSAHVFRFAVSQSRRLWRDSVRREGLRAHAGIGSKGLRSHWNMLTVTTKRPIAIDVTGINYTEPYDVWRRTIWMKFR